MRFRDYIEEALGFKVDVSQIHNNMYVKIVQGTSIVGELDVDHQKKKATVYLNDESTTSYIDGTPQEKKAIKGVVMDWLKSKGMGNYKVSV
jgi:activator of HSP90 ATPase